MKTTTLLTVTMLGASLAITAPAHAGTDDYIGEIFMVGSNFCPRGSAPANGQLLPIAQNTALFSLLGTTFGGDGRTTFGLPDLRGRTPVHAGQGPGLSNIRLGSKGGVENANLTPTDVKEKSQGGGQGGGGSTKTVADASGGNAVIPVRDPYQAIQYCVVLQGTYPSRS